MLEEVQKLGKDNHFDNNTTSQVDQRSDNGRKISLKIWGNYLAMTVPRYLTHYSSAPKDRVNKTFLWLLGL